MKINKLSFKAALLSLFIANASIAAPFNNLIVFGDSLSDIGNNSWLAAIGAPLTNLDAQANKYTWANYLSQKLFNASPYYSARRNIAPLTDSVVYAYASADSSNDYLAADWPNLTPLPIVNGACTSPGLIKDSLGEVNSSCVPGVLKQVDLYLKDVNYVPSKTTLFIIWAGANDLFYKLQTGEPPEKIVTTAITNLVQAKNQLLSKGVSPEQIYVLDLPDLSLTPFAIKNGLKLTQLCLYFNSVLTSLFTNPSDPTHIPTTHIISMFNLLNTIVQSPDKYNLTNVTDSCVEKGQVPLCKGFLFYDMKHPTAAIHDAISDYVSKQI